MIFIIVFRMTMQTFAWANMGSLRWHLFGPLMIYYAMTTQNSFFWSKKHDFYRCHASGFWLRNPVFNGFLAFTFSVVLHGEKIGLFRWPKKHSKYHVKSMVFYNDPNSALCRAWSVMVFGRFFHFLNYCFTWSLLP